MKITSRGINFAINLNMKIITLVFTIIVYWNQSSALELCPNSNEPIPTTTTVEELKELRKQTEERISLENKIEISDANPYLDTYKSTPSLSTYKKYLILDLYDRLYACNYLIDLKKYENLGSIAPTIAEIGLTVLSFFKRFSISTFFISIKSNIERHMNNALGARTRSHLDLCHHMRHLHIYFTMITPSFNEKSFIYKFLFTDALYKENYKNFFRYNQRRPLFLPDQIRKTCPLEYPIWENILNDNEENQNKSKEIQ